MSYFFSIFCWMVLSYLCLLWNLCSIFLLMVIPNLLGSMLRFVFLHQFLYFINSYISFEKDTKHLACFYFWFPTLHHSLSLLYSRIWYSIITLIFPLGHCVFRQQILLSCLLFSNSYHSDGILSSRVFTNCVCIICLLRPFMPENILLSLSFQWEFS